MKHPVRIVVAVGPDNGIGYKGGLPWPQLPLDLHMFRQVTTSTQDPLCRNAIVMGRITWASLRHRALPNRLNVIVSSSDLSSPKRIGSALNISEDQRAQVHVARSFRDALQWLDSKDDIETVYAIGGVAIYAEAMALDACDKLYVTHVRKQFTSDRFLPPIDATRWRVTSSRRREDAGGIEIDVNVYERVVAPLSPPLVHEEQQYLDLIREVMRDGISRGDRTGVGTRSVFGRCMRFDLRQHFPLLTTKRVFWRGVVEELLWFIRGETDARLLSEKGVKIWDQNASKEFLASVGLGHREAGDLGPVYGWQWRHFGATYVDCKTDYTGKGVDQLAAVLDALRNKPNDRRIILSAWNPKDISSMALPPCHLLAQFFVANGELTCLMYQRSADLGLGVPFNIASYALLTRILAHLSGLRAREFVHVLGDAHVYNNHDAPLRAQLENAPRPFPRLNILAAPTTTLEALRFEDFQLEGYEPHASIKMDMAV